VRSRDLELPWRRPEWLAEATAWIRARVDVTGEIEQPHVRWWSTVLRVPTAGGGLFFKAVAPIHRFEAPLTARLAELQPARMTEVVDVDPERGWFLMRDAGTRLRELMESPADLHHWERVLPEYARLQLEGCTARGRVSGARDAGRAAHGSARALP
jgi:hypothetical protein